MAGAQYGIKPVFPFYLWAMQCRIFLFLLAAMSGVISCRPASEKKPTMTPFISADPHSAAGQSSARINHQHFDLQVNFASKVLHGATIISFENPDGADSLFLDIRNLRILSVEKAGEGIALEYSIGAEREFLGQTLKISLKEVGEGKISIRYETKPDAAALQWLEPALTAGKKYPMLFTQGQAILSRTWFPCQDSPGIRFRWSADVAVPAGMRALMSADKQEQKDGKFHFEMSKPVPAYLVALAVGNLSVRELDARSAVYAEPEVLDRAAWEFADVGKMLTAAENLYGPYRWGRYDVLVLPPSFPFGGMENPCLTFATPTILAGDRSLVSLIAHELAHSWSGNLVTNATWDDFWLNEGFTVYFERRIMEVLEGKDYADMLAVIGWGDLQHTLKELGPDSPDTRLKLDLKGRDADDGMTDIAYEKGYRLLCLLEEKAGRESWDAFLKKYFEENAFHSMTTESFLEYLDVHLLKAKGLRVDDLKLKDWIYQPGLPAVAKEPVSIRFKKAEELAAASSKGNLPGFPEVKDWSSHEWLHYLRQLDGKMPAALAEKLDKRFQFIKSGNSEILFQWLLMGLKNGYAPAYEVAEDFMLHTGRRKFVLPLYKELCRTTAGRDLAQRIFAKAATSYHPVTRGSVARELGETTHQ
jgi:leukotriene-A4 hydrolase